eukprot:438991-Rhodomonas_salina.2
MPAAFPSYAGHGAISGCNADNVANCGRAYGAGGGPPARCSPLSPSVRAVPCTKLTWRMVPSVPRTTRQHIEAVRAGSVSHACDELFARDASGLCECGHSDVVCWRVSGQAHSH